MSPGRQASRLGYSEALHGAAGEVEHPPIGLAKQAADAAGEGGVERQAPTLSGIGAWWRLRRSGRINKQTSEKQAWAGMLAIILPPQSFSP
jgi:hypothetical protein